LYLAAALGLKGDADGERTALDEFLKLKPEMNSLAKMRANFPASYGNPEFVAVAEKTVDLGLRRAGLPED
jgi:adenylate cyclase